MNNFKNISIFLLLAAILLAAWMIGRPDKPLVADNLAPQSEPPTTSLVVDEGYRQSVRTWLGSLPSISLAEVQAVRQQILDFKGDDKNLGPVHIRLYLAFVNLEKFIQTGDKQYQSGAQNDLAAVAVMLPDLAPDIEQLSRRF